MGAFALSILITGGAAAADSVPGFISDLFPIGITAYAADAETYLGELTVYQSNLSQYVTPASLAKVKLDMKGIDPSKVSWANNIYVSIDRNGIVSAKKINTTVLSLSSGSAKTEELYNFGSTTVTGYYIENSQKYHVSFKVNVKDYAEVCVNRILDDFIAKNIHKGLTQMQKLKTICEYISKNYVYSAKASSLIGIVSTGGGDCWAHSYLTYALCDKAGLKVKRRNDNYNRWHWNNIVLIDGKPYEVETSYESRNYTIYPASEFEYQYFEGRILLTSVSSFNPTLIVPTHTSACEKIDSISNYALNGNHTGRFIRNIIVRSNIKKIPSSAFTNNPDLAKVMLAPGVTEIDRLAMSDCPKLAYVYIPSTVTLIDESSFDGSPKVTIRCKKGSYAYNFAKKHNISILLTDNDDLPAVYRQSSLAGSTVTLSRTSFEYDGKEQTPDANVVLNGKQLTKGKDYLLTYTNNINKGTATVTVTGINSYKGTVSRQFTITRKGNVRKEFTMRTKDGKTVNISLAYTEAYYNGTTRCPAVTVTCGGKKLTKNKDYTLKYTNNDRIGTATVTVTGLGNYAGKASGDYYIDPLPVNKCTIVLLSKGSASDLPRFKLTYMGNEIPTTNYYYYFSHIEGEQDFSIYIYSKNNLTGVMEKHYDR